MKMSCGFCTHCSLACITDIILLTLRARSGKGCQVGLPVGQLKSKQRDNANHMSYSLNS